MRAFLIAQQTWRNGGDAFDAVSPALLNIGGQSFIEWQVQSLVNIGVKVLRVTGGCFTSKIEKTLGDGSRWGIEISYIICTEGKPWGDIFILNRSFFMGADSLLLIRGNVIFRENTNVSGDESIVYSVSLENFLDTFSSSFGALYLPKNDIDQVLKIGFPAKVIESVNAYLVDTHSAMLKINSLILGSDKIFGTPVGRRKFNDIYIDDTAKVDSKVNLQSPLVIGGNCRISENVTICNGSSIGYGCIIDEGATIDSSIIDSKTYIGKGTVVKSSIISGHRIYSLSTGSSAYVPDNFWLDSLKKDKNNLIVEDILIGEKIFAFFLWLLYLPYFLMIGCVKKEYKAIFGVKSYKDLDGHFDVGEIYYEMDKELSPFYAILSALPEVVRGKMHLCGRMLLSPEQVDMIPPDFLKIYLKSYPGIVTISDNLLCDNMFQRKVQDIYLCGRLGFFKRYFYL